MQDDRVFTGQPIRVETAYTDEDRRRASVAWTQRYLDRELDKFRRKLWINFVILSIVTITLSASIAYYL